MTTRVGVLGARGHVASELLPMLARHPELSIVALGSRELAGKTSGSVLDENGNALEYRDLVPADVGALELDVALLGLPNGHSQPFVDALLSQGKSPVVIDLSADHRFDSAWTYGLPELSRDSLRGARLIANPGCYATAMALSIAPFLDDLAAPPHVFGVSGYSGAGTGKSPRNDPDVLRDNVIPYGLVGHVHEREASHHLGTRVRFVPHVAPFFRGITLTITLEIQHETTSDALFEHVTAAYRDEPLVRVIRDVPLVRDVASRDDVTLGGFAADGAFVSFVATIDNLRKGAATQAVQNLNLALGFPELTGIAP